MILRNISLVIRALGAGFTGCAKRAQVPKAPYQIAVEEYYRELDKAGTGDSLDGATAAVKSAIADNPANLETRVLYLNILLQRAFISSPPPDARTQFIAEFKRLHLGPPGAPGPDWVKPRTYVTFGDYLLRSGNEDSARQEPEAIHLAKAAFQAAAEFYLHGHKLAAAVATPTEGAIQERSNAVDGYTQSQRGILDMLANLSDANTSGPASNSELTRQLGEPLNERLSLVFSKGELPAASFSGTMITPSALIAQSRFYQDSANRNSKTLLVVVRSTQGAGRGEQHRAGRRPTKGTAVRTRPIEGHHPAPGNSARTAVLEPPPLRSGRDGIRPWKSRISVPGAGCGLRSPVAGRVTAP